MSSFQNEEYIGTEPWSASEVFDEDGVVTNKTDVFALGCVVYEMLALEAPVSEFCWDFLSFLLVNPRPVEL